MGYTALGAVVGFVIGWTLYWYWSRSQADRAAREREQALQEELYWQDTPLVDRATVEEISASEPEEPEKAEAGDAADAELKEAKEAETEETTDAEPDEEIIAYCAHCRKQRLVTSPEQVVTDRGRYAVRGTCKECGGKVFSFVSSPE